MARRIAETGDYPDNWPEIAKIVKDKADWKCIRCKHPHDIPAKYMLTTHHLDMFKPNCAWWNLAALCQRCHLSIQGRVVMDRVWMFDHTEWFIPYVAGFYAARYARFNKIEVPLDYFKSLELFSVDWIMENATALIDYGRGKPIKFDISASVAIS